MDDVPPTQRIGAFELAYAPATMERDAERPLSDDEPTIELPSPPLPPGLPSPLGDDDVVDAGATGFFDTLPMLDLGLDLDLDADFLPAEEVPPCRYAGEPDGMRWRVAASNAPISSSETLLPMDVDLHARRAVVASWSIAAATAGFCTYVVTLT